MPKSVALFFFYIFDRFTDMEYVLCCERKACQKLSLSQISSELDWLYHRLFCIIQLTAYNLCEWLAAHDKNT